MKRKPAAVVWDLDGTLVDSAPDIAAALNSLLEENGLQPLDEQRVRRMIGNGVAALIQRGFAEHGYDRDEIPIKTLQSRFMEIYETCAVDRTRLFPGVIEALQGFAEAGVPQAVCTNKPQGIAEQVLSGLGIADYFRLVIGGDTLPRRKPDPMPLRVAISGLDAQPGGTLMIGDSEVDMAAARAAGARVALVPFGYSRSPVTTLGADFIICNLRDIVIPASLSFGSGDSPRSAQL